MALGAGSGAVTVNVRCVLDEDPEASVAVASTVCVPAPSTNGARHPPMASMSAATDTPPTETVTPLMLSGCEPVRLSANAAGLVTRTQPSPVAAAIFASAQLYEQVARAPTAKLRQ